VDKDVVRNDCPLNKDQLGAQAWGVLHTIAANYPQNPTEDQKNNIKLFFELFSKVYPCSACGSDMQEQMKVTPLNPKSQSSISQWLCKIHNEVNKKLGKPEFDCRLVNQRWKDGWADGSCD